MTLYGFKYQFQKNSPKTVSALPPSILGIIWLVFSDPCVSSCKSKQQAWRRKQFQILSEEKAEKAFNMLTGKLTLKWEHPENLKLETSLTMRPKN